MELSKTNIIKKYKLLNTLVKEEQFDEIYYLFGGNTYTLFTPTSYKVKNIKYLMD